MSKLPSVNPGRARAGKLPLMASRGLAFGLVLLLIIALLLHRSFSHKSVPIGASQHQPIRSRQGAPRTPVLEILAVHEYGSIIEIQGRSEPGTTVMINGEKVGLIWDGTTFKHFVGPFTEGPTVITLTAQNEDGGVNTKQVPVDIK